MTSAILMTQPEKQICLLTLNRPEKRNALNGAMIQEWLDVMKKIAADKNIHVVILNANGEHFCAGADIAWMQTMAQKNYTENFQDAFELAKLLNCIRTFPKPVISLVQGATMGGGLGVIACCDMVLAAENATFCFSEVKIGLAASSIAPHVISVIGERAARYYFLTAEKFSVQKALELNLVQQIFPRDKLLDAGLSLAKTILKNSPHAVSEAKKIIQRIVPGVTEDMMHMTAEHLATMRASPDAKEGLNAFLEKRDPVWK